MSSSDEEVAPVEDVGDDLELHPRLPGTELSVHGLNGQRALVGDGKGERLRADRDAFVSVGTVGSIEE